MGARARLHAQRQFATGRFMNSYLDAMRPVVGCLDPVLQ
jgi:hypothetical protein